MWSDLQMLDGSDCDRGNFDGKRVSVYDLITLYFVEFSQFSATVFTNDVESSCETSRAIQTNQFKFQFGGVLVVEYCSDYDLSENGSKDGYDVEDVEDVEDVDCEARNEVAVKYFSVLVFFYFNLVCFV